MTDLLAEVDNMMRRERMENLWRQHRNKFIAVIALIILATALHSAWDGWSTHTKTKNTDALIALMENPQFPDNVKPDELEIKGGARGIALLSAAKAYLSVDKKDEARKLYEAVSNDRSIGSEIRQLGTLMSVRLQAEQPDAKSDELLAELKKIYTDNASPWRHHARLDAALIAGKQKNYTLAREILAPTVKEENLPNTFGGKVRALDHLYSLKTATGGKDSRS